MRIESPLQKIARTYPDRTFIAAGGTDYSLRHVSSRVARISERFSILGVTESDRVAIFSSNSTDYIMTLLTVWEMGVSAITLNPISQVGEWRTLVDKVQCKLLIYSGLELDASEFSCKTLSFEEISSTSARVVTETPVKISQWNLNREALIVATSGSTGIPKGVRLTLGNLYHNALGANQRSRLEANDCWLLSLPLFHVGGIGIVMRSLLAGAKLAVPPSLKSTDILSTIASGGVTHISVVPTMLKSLIENDKGGLLPKLEMILLGGAAPSAQLLEQCRELCLPIVRTYGLSEAASQVTLGTQDSFRKKPLSSGTTSLHCEMRLARGGEIQVRGKTLFSGYLGEVNKIAESDWFATGDIGVIDSDGEIEIKGRKDDMIVSGGENIYPVEIELALSDVTGGHEVKVIGVDDAKWGERPIAFVLHDEAGFIDPGNIHAALVGKLSRFKLPDSIIVINEWPLTPTGKIDTHQLRKIYTSQE